jgi:hypothetical protein
LTLFLHLSCFCCSISAKKTGSQDHCVRDTKLPRAR